MLGYLISPVPGRWRLIIFVSYEAFLGAVTVVYGKWVYFWVGLGMVDSVLLEFSLIFFLFSNSLNFSVRYWSTMGPEKSSGKLGATGRMYLYSLSFSTYSWGVEEQRTLNHQSHVRPTWLNIVPFGQRNEACPPFRSQ